MDELLVLSQEVGFFFVDLPQGGLEVPCLLKFQGDDTNVSKVKKLLSTTYSYQSGPAEEVCTSTEPTTAATTEDHCVSQPSKKRKLGDDSATSMKKHSGVWLTFNSITLTTEDKDIITFGNWLTDKHMNFAQSLLKKQNNNVAGLYSTVVYS